MKGDKLEADQRMSTQLLNANASRDFGFWLGYRFSWLRKGVTSCWYSMLARCMTPWCATYCCCCWVATDFPPWWHHLWREAWMNQQWPKRRQAVPVLLSFLRILGAADCFHLSRSTIEHDNPPNATISKPEGSYFTLPSNFSPWRTDSTWRNRLPKLLLLANDPCLDD